MRLATASARSGSFGPYFFARKPRPQSAELARFIIADLTDPSSIPKELEAIVRGLAVPVQPLLEGSAKPYAMFKDYWKYDWVLQECAACSMTPFRSTSRMRPSRAPSSRGGARGQRFETAGGGFRLRDDEPAPRVGAGPHRTP